VDQAGDNVSNVLFRTLGEQAGEVQAKAQQKRMRPDPGQWLPRVDKLIIAQLAIAPRKS
jgi:hypothetical protein